MPDEILTSSSSIRRLVDRVGQSREELDPVAGESVRVLAGEEVAPTELEHLEDAELAAPCSLDGERQDRVGDRELGGSRDLVVAVLADPERRHRERGQPTGELVEEPSEVLVPPRVRMQRFEAVDDEHPGASLLDELADPLEHARKAFVVHGPAQILVEHRGADRPLVEEAQRLAVSQDLLERLGDRGEVDRRPFRRGVVEGVLLREDRLPGSGESDDEVDPVAGQASAQHVVQSFASRRIPDHSSRERLGSEERALPEQVLDGRHQLQGIEGLLEERVGPVFQRFVA